MMRQSFLKLLIKLTVLGFALTALNSYALDEKEEYTRKTEILKNLFKVVGWPAQKPLGPKIKICILGNDPHNKYFQTLAGTRIDKHQLTVKTAPTLAKLPKGCDVVLVGKSEKEHQLEIIEHFAEKPVLVIADIENFAKSGGSMNYWILNGKVAITANIESLTKSRLSLDLKAFDQITLIPESADLPKN